MFPGERATFDEAENFIYEYFTWSSASISLSVSNIVFWIIWITHRVLSFFFPNFLKFHLKPWFFKSFQLYVLIKLLTEALSPKSQKLK